MTASTTERPAGTPAATARPGPLGRLADLTFRHRGRTLLAWLAVLILAVGLSGAFGGEYEADYSAPGSDSSQAQELLETRFPAQAGDTVDVVVRAEEGSRRHPSGPTSGPCWPSSPQCPTSRASTTRTQAPAGARPTVRPLSHMSGSTS